MFLARYGHQQVPDLLEMESADLAKMAMALGRLIEKESKTGRTWNERAASGG